MPGPRKTFPTLFRSPRHPSIVENCNHHTDLQREATTDPANFPPIALTSCLYKLLMTVLAKRMTTFSISNDLLSNAQKSARPSEGCYEHAFILQSVLSDARRQPCPLCLAWLDIGNAFGSIPHSALSTTLLHMGFPPDLVRMITNVYTGSTTEIPTSTGKTSPIPIYSGVKQGYPLSAILFNLSLELVIRKCISAAALFPRDPLKHHGLSIPILAYADDIFLLARNSQGLQHLLDAVFSTAITLNLKFRPDKCTSLCLNKTAPRIQQHELLVQGKRIPSLAKEHYRYLGVPIVLIPNITEIATLVDTLCDKLKKIRQSLLCPWQKLDAICTFVQPCLTCALCTTDPTNTFLLAYRKQLLTNVRSICQPWHHPLYLHE